MFRAKSHIHVKNPDTVNKKINYSKMKYKIFWSSAFGFHIFEF